MANNDLKILITGALDPNKSVTEINKNLAQLQDKIDKLNVSIKIDDSVIKVLNDFATQMNKVADIAKNTGKVIQENINPDGSRTKITSYNGIINEIQNLGATAKKTGDAIKDASQQQVNYLNQVKGAYNDVTKVVEKYNAEQAKQRTKITLAEGNNTRTVNLNAQNQVTGYTDTINKAKDAQDAQKLTDAQDKLTQAMRKVYDQGILNEQFFTNFNKAINSSKNVEEVDKLSAALQRVSQYTKNQGLQQNLLGQAQSLLTSGKNVDTQGLTGLITNLNNLNLSGSNATRQLNLMQGQLKEFQAGASTVSEITNTLGSSFQRAFQNMSIYFGGFALMTQSFQAIKEGISYINDLNKSLTEISIVTYQNQQQVNALGDSYNKLAQQMGVTTIDVAKESAELYRQGLTTSQVTDRMKTITEYAKISSMDTKQATEIMTSAINSMGVSAQRASDVWAYLGDATATGADEIGIAMQKVGGTAGSLGVSFEQVSSWIAVISSRTRESASTIGDSIKSILARMQSLKENGFDQTDGTKVNQVAKALSSIGVQLVDQSGNFRNLGTVMDEIGKKWSGLDQRTKSYIATTVAGTYQQSRFLNLMEGYTGNNGVLDLYQKAMDSAGTTEKKFQLYQQGTEAQLNKLTAAWQGFWMSSVNSSEIGAVLNSLTGMANALKTVVDHVGILPPALAVAGIALIAFNGGIKSIMTNGNLMITMLKGIPVGLTSMESALAASTLKTNLLNTATKTLTLTMGALRNIGIFLAGSFLPMAAFMAAGIAIEKISQAISDYNQKQQEAKQAQDDLVKSYSSNSKQIDELASKYKDLSDQVASGKIDKSNQDYLDTMNQLGKLMPDLVANEDQHGNKILASADAVKKELDYAKQLKEIQDKQTVADFEADLNNQSSKIDGLIKKINQAKNAVNTPFETYNTGDGTSVTIQKDGSQQLDDQRQLLANERDLQLALQNSKSYIQDKSKAYMDMEGTSQRLSSAQQKLISSYIDETTASKTSVKDGEDFKRFLSDTTNATADLARKLAEIPADLDGAFSAKDIQSFSKDQIEYLRSIGLIVKDGGTDWDNYSKALQSVFKDADTVNKIIDTLKNSTKQESDATDEATYSVDTLDKSLKAAKGDYNAVKDVINQMIQSKQYDMAVTASQNEAYSALSDTLSPVNKMLEDMANGQTLTASSAMDLIQKVPEMTKYLSIQNGQVQVNIQGVLDWRDAQIASFQDMINAEKVQIDAQSKALKTKLANYGVEIQAILSVAQANDALAEAEKKHAENAAKINGSNAPGAMHASMVEQGQYDEVASGINKIKDAYSSLDQLSSMASTGLTQVGTSMEKTNSTTQQSIYVTDKYKQSMDALNESLKKLQSETNNYAKGTKDYEDALQRQIDLLKQQKDLTDAQASSLQQQIASGVIQQTGMITKSNSNGSVSSGSGGSSNYNYASGGSTQAQIWNFLKGKGLSDSAIAGIMGNLQQESGFSTSALNPNGAYGLAQWMGGRLSNLKSQANSSSLDTQLNYLWSEWAPMMSNYGASAFNNLDPTQAAYIFEKLFERSGGDANATRQKYANQIYSQFAGKGGQYNTSAASTSSSGDNSKTAANMAQDIDQAKSQLLQLQDASQGYVDQMQALKLQIIQDRAVMYDNLKKTYESQITQYDYLQNVQDKNSANWLHTQMNREAAYNQEISLQQQSIDYLQQQIQYNTDLTASQKQTLSDDVLSRQKELLSLEQQLYDTRSKMADDIVNTYKQALTDMKDAATKNIDNMINDINKQADQASYKKKLTDAQKSAQDIQNQITQLSLDDSTSAKKKIADLKTQLSNQQDSISQMVTDNDKQQRIDNLNTQKQKISDYYDNMLNDEQKFTQMRSEILNLNNQSIIKDLNSFSGTIQKNVSILGTSVVNTIIDMINRANGYMNLSTANSSVIGHIASLDTGGLLPSWGSGGKMLLAHEKEMILNKTDTSNVLKIVNVARDFFSNIVKLPDLSGMKTAIAGGNNVYNLNFNIDKVTGDVNGAKTLFTQLVNGIKSKGGNI